MIKPFGDYRTFNRSHTKIVFTYMGITNDCFCIQCHSDLSVSRMGIVFKTLFVSFILFRKKMVSVNTVNSYIKELCIQLL